MFRGPKVVKRCSRGHVMDLALSSCPRCTGRRERKNKGRQLDDATVIVEPADDPLGKTVVHDRRRAAPAPSEGPALVATLGPLAGREIPLAHGKTRIGKSPRRAPDGTRPEDGWAVVAVPEDRYMSKDHASVNLGSGGLVVTDPGSTNGTFVNGAKIAGLAVLQDGDEVRMGESVFKVRLPRRE